MVYPVPIVWMKAIIRYGADTCQSRWTSCCVRRPCRQQSFNYLDIPEMPIDNTDTERLIRDMVMGKKSYLFCRDLDACKRAAMMYSLFGACKVLDKNPERWLCHVLKNIKTTPNDKLYTLLPEFWEDEEQQTASTGISR